MRSASLPRRPMTMPGRAVWTSTRSLSRVRSTSMRLIAAWGSCVMMSSRIFQSSIRYSLYSRSENHRDFQSVVTPSLNPYGLTF